jgi:hypothetical protein
MSHFGGPHGGPPVGHHPPPPHHGPPGNGPPGHHPESYGYGAAQPEIKGQVVKITCEAAKGLNLGYSGHEVTVVHANDADAYQVRRLLLLRIVALPPYVTKLNSNVVHSSPFVVFDVSASSDHLLVNLASMLTSTLTTLLVVRSYAAMD